jgi:hypothetical protein
MSASSDGIGCENTWNWCPSGLPLQNFTPWKTGEPGNPGNEVCSYLDWKYLLTMSPIMNDGDCGSSLMVLCEVN